MSNLQHELTSLHLVILQEPENLDVRLVYSDALEETGDEWNLLRAELIRVQIALGKLKEPEQKTPGNLFGKHVDDCWGCVRCKWNWSDKTVERCDYHTLLKRSKEILHSNSPGHWNPNPGLGWYWSGEVFHSLSTIPRWEYRNGFVETLRIPWGEWEKCGSAIVHVQPITALTITDKEPVKQHHSTTLIIPNYKGVSWYLIPNYKGVSWYLHRGGALASNEVPRLVFELMEGGAILTSKSSVKEYPTWDEAVSAFNTAALRWARIEAGLEKYPYDGTVDYTRSV